MNLKVFLLRLLYGGQKEKQDYSDGPDIDEDFRAQLKDIEDKLDKQIWYAQNWRSGLRNYQRDFNRARREICNLIGYLVENGIHPLTGEEEGRYAFIDFHGKISALSPRTRNSLGYDPRGKNYTCLLPEGVATDLRENNLDSLILKTISNGKERIVRLKDVDVSEYKVGDFVLGYVVDFREIGRIELLKDALRKRVSRTTQRIIEKASEEAGKIIGRKKPNTT